MAEPYSSPSGDMFSEKQSARSFPAAPVSIAAAVLIVVVALGILFGRRHAGAAESVAYAPNLQFSNLQMSESESLSGGKSTYIDGQLSNHGPATVTGVHVRVSFPAEGGAAPQVLPAAVQLIRSRQPYIDVQPLSAAPLAPGATGDFRLIFEGVSDSWNQQPPAIQVTGVTTR